MNKKVVQIVATLLLLVMLCVPFCACNTKDDGPWHQLLFATKEAQEQGYIGGTACQHLTYLARSKQHPKTMYFGTDAAGMCRSFDGGKTWEPCNVGLFTSGVSTIEIDPKNDKHVVVFNATSSETTGKYSALYYTLDGGDTWTKSENTQGMGISGSHYYYDVLQFDEWSYDVKLGYCTDIYFSTPCDRDTVWPSAIRSDPAYAQKRGVYKSTDSGMSFEQIPDSADMRDSIITIVKGKKTFANPRGIFKLEGDKFTKINDMVTHSLQYVKNKYYILCEDGIYTSKKLTEFEKIESDNFDKCFEQRNLVVSDKNPNYMVMYAKKSKNNQYSYRPYFSHDGGKTWTLGNLLENEELFYYYTYHAGVSSFDPKDENTIVSIIGGEVIRSTDGGENWNYSGSGVHNLSVGGQFHFNIYDENICLMGGYDFGGAFTDDGGKTWVKSTLSKDGDGKDIMGAYAADKNTWFGVYCDTWSPGEYFTQYRYVCFSHDAGKTVNIDPSKIITSKTYKQPGNEAGGPNDVYAALNVDRSIGTGHESSYQSPNDKKVLFCANFRSVDNGYTWQNMQDATTGEKCLQVYTHSGKTLYGCSKQSGFVLKSTDDGKTWQKVNQTELTKWKPSVPSHIVDIAVDSVNGYIYACYGDKLWRIKLDGTDIKDLTAAETFVKDNFNTYRCRTVAVDPNFPNIVYVGGSGDFYMSIDSVRRTMDSGETWETMVNSASKVSVVKSGSLGYEARCLRVRSDGTVWCACLCLGVCTLDAPYSLPAKR